MAIDVRQRNWNSDHSSGLELSSEHYRIYTTTTNRSLRRYLPGFMEAAHSHYLELTGLSDLPKAERMTIYMMASRAEWAALTRKVFGRRSGAALSIEAGGYCHRGICVFWNMGGLGTLSVAAHEGLHQFFHHRLRDRLPMWLEEGLCTTMEGYEIHDGTVRFTPLRNIIRFGDLRTAIVQDRWIELPGLLVMDSAQAVAGQPTERAVGYYGQLWALVRYIRSVPEYRKGMLSLLADAAAGRLNEAMNVPPEALATLRLRGRIYNRTVSEPLFRYYVTDDLETFSRRYKAFAKKLARLE